MKLSDGESEHEDFQIDHEEIYLRELPQQLQEYFVRRLHEVVETSELNPESVASFTVKVSQKMGGVAQGICEVQYLDENGKKYRSRGEIILLLKKETRKFREYFFLNAQEHRERLLLTQFVQEMCTNQNKIQYVEDAFYNSNQRNNVFFTYGNVTILSWGAVINNAEFHTQSQIFPLGFRCIRQEKDEFTNAVVDCLCEVDAIYSRNCTELFSSFTAEHQNRIIRSEASHLSPLFRITVSWRLSDSLYGIKVYEGKTPQVVWQGAMLEGSKRVRSERICNLVSENHETAEFMLREKVRESRRIYFRTLRQEQSKGNIEAVRPRIVVDSVENFFDLHILKLVEGMTGVSDCKNYVFVDARNGEHVQRQTLNDGTDILQKLKHLDLFARRSIELAVSESKKRKREEMDKLNERNFAVLESFQLTRSELTRQTKKEKEDSFTRLESVIRNEQSQLNNKSLYLFSNEGTSSTALSTINSRPDPKMGRIPLDGKTFGRLLELREFVKSMQKLGFTISKVPSVDDFIGACKRIYFPEQWIIHREEVSIWTTVAVDLVSVLYPEFERVLGLDLVSSQIGESKLCVCEITWKEIFRLILTTNLCRELRLNDTEITGILKGRGFFTSPEAVDRKALKLIKRRLLYANSARGELQETVVGNQNGIYVTVRVPRKTTLQEVLMEVLLFCENSKQLNDSLCFDFIRDALKILKDFPVDAISGVILSPLEQLLEQFSLHTISQKEMKEQVLILIAPFLADQEKPGSTLRGYHDQHFHPDKLRTSGEQLCFEGGKIQFLEEIKVAEFMGKRFDEENLEMRLDALPVLMQRCFNVLFCIVDHPLVESIISGGEFKSISSFVQHNLTFSTIQDYILNGRYYNKISRFYEDVSVVFETLLSFFSESSVQKSVVTKLYIIFERLFYEMVITIECPLPTSGSCQICRLSEIPSSNSFALCDRCDGCFHLNCLEPPFDLTTVPRGEWYCPFCIEQKGVASSHPHRFAQVTHPSKSCRGEVVGIETKQGQLIFVIDFGLFREQWSSEIVRSHLASNTSDVLLSPADFTEYDRACTLCRGYGGWGGTSLIIPGVLNSFINQDANLISETDESFEMRKKCLCLLLSDREFSVDEWLNVLETLRELIFCVYSCQEMLPDQDCQEKVCAYVNDLIQSDNARFQEKIMSHEPEVSDFASQSSFLKCDEEDFRTSTDNVEEALISHNLQGREDALLCVRLLLQVLKEENASASLSELLSSADGLSTIVGKGFGVLAKVSENILDEWLKGWESEISMLVSRGPLHNLCQLCGKCEMDLCSPLTYCLALGDWVSKFGSSIYRYGYISRDIHRAITRPQFVVEMDQFKVSTMLLAHACCGELLNLRRASMIISRKNSDHQFLMEKLCKLGSSLTAPIGVDRDGCLYWIFDFPFNLYVGRPQSFSPICEKNENYEWSIYKGVEILNLYDWLSHCHSNELELKRIIRILFPDLFGGNSLKNWPQVESSVSIKCNNDETPLCEDESLNNIATDKLLSILENYAYSPVEGDSVFAIIRDLLWFGKVEEVKKQENGKLWCKVSFEEWNECYSSWHEQKYVIPKDFRLKIVKDDVSVKRISKLLKERYFLKSVITPPRPLAKLNALSYLRVSSRSGLPPNFSFTNCEGDTISMLKTALLIIESSLPSGAIDDSEERWGNNMEPAWRESVNLASDATSLMQCQLMLEYGIRTAWLKPTGLKFFSCLPSRIHAVRTASLSAVAIRIWALDMTIKYDKVEESVPVAKVVKKIQK